MAFKSLDAILDAHATLDTAQPSGHHTIKTGKPESKKINVEQTDTQQVDSSTLELLH